MFAFLCFDACVHHQKPRRNHICITWTHAACFQAVGVVAVGRVGPHVVTTAAVAAVMGQQAMAIGACVA
jgi:hypothetical protein